MAFHAIPAEGRAQPFGHVKTGGPICRDTRSFIRSPSEMRYMLSTSFRSNTFDVPTAAGSVVPPVAQVIGNPEKRHDAQQGEKG